MHELHVRRISKALTKQFENRIDLSDVKERPEAEITINFLTRSQAALALSHIAGIDKQIAADSIVDGFDDNGIDAIYFDEVVRTVYVVQSKWIQSGKKGIDLGAVEKFLSGFNDLLTAKFERFNDKVGTMKPILEKALDSYDVDFSLILAYTSTQPLSIHAERKLKDFLDQLNDSIDVVTYRLYNQKDIYNAISGSFDNSSISIDVTLYDWGQIDEPFKAYYGQVSAEEISLWYKEHNSRLFARNLRKFKGDTEVNRAIKTTLIKEPLKFWYFNNGVTILCTKIGKKPIGGANRDRGQFICEGVSVVNGAQTVGNIATSIAQGFPKAKDARVLVRFISLENCPPDFATEVTTATNTQNRIERRDFASLDPTHERLRTDLMLDLDKIYAYKSGDKVTTQSAGCDIEEATIALACAYPLPKMAADAKRNIGMFWEDIKKPPYTFLFNNKLSALRLWRCVEISRIVELVLIKEGETLSGNARLIAVHGNRFILHRVFQFLQLDKFDELSVDFDSIKATAEEETTKVLNQIIAVIEEYYRDSYLNTFFKNGSKCAELAELLPDPPPLPQIPYFESKRKSQQMSLFEKIDE